jgi:hypothetical protein
MTIRSWLRNLFARPVTRPLRKAPRRAGLVMEALDDGFVPSVTALANGGTFNGADGGATVGLTASQGTLHALDGGKLSWHDATANSERKSLSRSHRPTIGFWLGGGLLGTAGCILGVCMPYHHPVAVMISALWWGIYLGCLGGSLGGLIILLTERAPAFSIPREERVDC